MIHPMLSLNSLSSVSLKRTLSWRIFSSFLPLQTQISWYMMNVQPELFKLILPGDKKHRFVLNDWTYFIKSKHEWQFVAFLLLIWQSDSILLLRSSTSILNSLFSFSSFCLTLWRLSICSPSSAVLSACFLRRAAAVASWCSVASSRSRRSFRNSASRFLFISIWTDVAPPASSSLSLISSSSLERSDLCFSTLARAALSASISSSSSSIRACDAKRT